MRIDGVQNPGGFHGVLPAEPLPAESGHDILREGHPGLDHFPSGDNVLLGAASLLYRLEHKVGAALEPHVDPVQARLPHFAKLAEALAYQGAASGVGGDPPNSGHSFLQVPQGLHQKIRGKHQAVGVLEKDGAVSGHVP